MATNTAPKHTGTLASVPELAADARQTDTANVQITANNIQNTVGRLISLVPAASQRRIYRNLAK